VSNDLIKIINAETGEEIEREMTNEEQAERNAEVADSLAKKATVEAAALQAVTDKAALLAKLGITADEAKLLLS
jgi:hypothetical protein